MNSLAKTHWYQKRTFWSCLVAGATGAAYAVVTHPGPIGWILGVSALAAAFGVNAGVDVVRASGAASIVPATTLNFTTTAPAPPIPKP